MLSGTYRHRCKWPPGPAIKKAEERNNNMNNKYLIQFNALIKFYLHGFLKFIDIRLAFIAIIVCVCVCMYVGREIVD